MRTVDFNYVVIRGGADYGKIWPATDSAPSLKMNEAGAIKTSLAGNFLSTVFGFDDLPIVGAEVNWLSDEIRPELVIDGVAYPLGIFLPATVQENKGQAGTALHSFHVDAYDRCWVVRDHYTESTTYFASGVNYLTAIENLLTTAGITLIRSVPTAATLAEAREDWNIGTSYLTIINQLLSEINYNPLWFDGEGTAILEPASVPEASSIQHTNDLAEPGVLVRHAVKRRTDI